MKHVIAHQSFATAESASALSPQRLDLLWRSERSCSPDYQPPAAEPLGYPAPGGAVEGWHDWLLVPGGASVAPPLAGIAAFNYRVTTINGMAVSRAASAMPADSWTDRVRLSYPRQRLASLAARGDLMRRLARRTRRMVGRAGAVLLLAGAGWSVWG